MNLNEVKASAKEKMNLCKMCRNCNGETCRGLTPGPGGKGSGSTFVSNVQKLKQVTLNMKVLHGDAEIDCSDDFFGHLIKAPIFVAPVANVMDNYGTNVDEETYLKAISEGCVRSGILPYYGDGVKAVFFDAPLACLKETDGHGIATIKPWVKELAFEKIIRAIATKPYAIAMDVDAAGLVSLRKSATPISFKTLEELKEIRSHIECPFIIKGVMTLEDAQTAIDCGADAIVVSNHGGRVMDDGRSSIEVLESICNFVDGRLKVYTDGGYRSGYDVFKALALGADGVLIGRPFSHAAIGSGAEGVEVYTKTLIAELEDAMRMTGCQCLEDIKRNCVHSVF